MKAENISNSKLRMLYDIKWRDEIAHVQLVKTMSAISSMCYTELPLKIN